MTDWLIMGGESGGRARPMQLEWARDLLAQCRLKVILGASLLVLPRERHQVHILLLQFLENISVDGLDLLQKLLDDGFLLAVQEAP